MNTADNQYKRYWEANITKWSDLYLDISHGHEEIIGPTWVRSLYMKLIFPMESRLMKQRYLKTIEFINMYCTPQSMVLDIGCGTGLFTVELLNRGASVKAIDFSESALQATQENVVANAPLFKGKVEYFLADVSRKNIPKGDIALAMGVAPYIHEIDEFYRNILSSCQVFFCLLVDPSHWINRLRRMMPWLNVRKLQFHSKKRIDEIIRQHGWHLVTREQFATGYLDIIVSPRFLHRGESQ